MADRRGKKKTTAATDDDSAPKTAPTAESRIPKEIIRKVVLAASYPPEEWEALCELVASDSESESESDSGSDGSCKKKTEGSESESGSESGSDITEDDYVEIVLAKKTYHVFWLYDKLFIKKPKDDVLLGSLEYYKPTKTLLVVSLDKSGATF